MNSNNIPEHYVTLFDNNFLPVGMCLHASMMKHAQPFHLWIVCMDEVVERQLRQLDLQNVSLIPLQEVETEALLGVKGGRTQGEYCWTLTPFTPEFVFDRDGKVSQVTYLDADIYFFDSPKVLLNEFSASDKDVLITEHAYAPEYDYTKLCGKFCVQFMTFKRTEGGRKVMQWWQDRCIEWCFRRYEDGKLGDQMYLNDWPERFANEVHVLQQKERTLAPWNAAYYLNRPDARVPVMFHFQNFRVLTDKKMRWYKGYRRMGLEADKYYQQYSLEMIRSLALIYDRFSVAPTANDENTIKRKLVKMLYILTRRTVYFDYSLNGVIPLCLPKE
jgi:hypothetical protein